MKKWMLFILLIAAGCSSKPVEYYNYQDDIKETDMEKLTVQLGDYVGEKDVMEIRDSATQVFIGEVLRLDSATCNLEGKAYSPIPYTQGTIKVLETFEGDVKDSITFVKLGGIVTLEEFDRNAPEEMMKIRLENRQNSGIAEEDAPKYVSNYMEGDNSLIPGKTYLFYAVYNEAYDRYELVGYSYGALEITDYGKEEATIQDPETKATVTLKDYVK